MKHITAASVIAASLLSFSACASLEDTGSTTDLAGDGKADHLESDLVDVTLSGTVPALHRVGAPVDVHVDLEHIGRATEVVRTTADADGHFTVGWERAWTFESFGAMAQVFIDIDQDGRCLAEPVYDFYLISPTIAIEGDWPALTGGPVHFLQSMWCDEFDDLPPAAEAPLDCAATCAVRGDACFTEADCNAFCDERVAYASQNVHDAFTICAETNPLCYLSIEDCTGFTLGCLEDCQAGGGEDCVASCAP